MVHITNYISVKHAIWITIIFLAIGLFINYIRGPKLLKTFYSDEDIKGGPIKLLKNYDSRLLENIKSASQMTYHNWSESAINTGSLQVLPIYFFGMKHHKLSEMPYLSSYVNNLPNIYSLMFLELGPKTHIDSNNGWAVYSNDTIRYMFCMRSNRVTIDIETDIKEINIGEWIIFDTTKLHQLHNNSDISALFMIIDIARPSSFVKGSNKSSDMTEVIAMIDLMNEINNIN